MDCIYYIYNDQKQLNIGVSSSINSKPKYSVLKPLSKTGKIAIQLFQKKKQQVINSEIAVLFKKKTGNFPKLLFYFEKKACSAVFIKKKQFQTLCQHTAITYDAFKGRLREFIVI